MSRVCMTKCMNDARTPLMRANYVRVHKWQESDGEFVEAGEISNTDMPLGDSGRTLQPRMVHSVSSRQIYLRSYKFSKEQTVPEKTKNYMKKFRQRMVIGKKKADGSSRSSKVKGKVRMKKNYGSSFSVMFQKILSCSTSVDVMA